MGIEEFAVPAKHPHKELHRPDIDQETSVRPSHGHRLGDYLSETGSDQPSRASARICRGFEPSKTLLSEPFKIIDESDPQIVMDIGFVAR
jgi:hypothetical protein